MIKDKINFPLEVSQWKETGLSMAAYCKEKGLNYQTFMYHASRIKKKELGADEPKTFIRIDFPEKTASGIEYHLPNGGYFVFPIGCSVQLIKSLIS